jgi:hypothetical protein
MISEKLAPTGELKIVVTDKHGKVKEARTEKNLVVTTGLTYIAARMTDTSQPTDMSHMAVGTGTTAVVIADTALETLLSTQHLMELVQAQAHLQRQQS